MSQKDLGRKLVTSSGNITMVVDNLERRSLVRRVRDEADRRDLRVHLTPEGRKPIAKIFPGHVAAIVAELAPLSPGEQDELGRLWRKLGRRDAVAAAGRPA